MRDRISPFTSSQDHTYRVHVYAIGFLVPILTLGLITKGQHDRGVCVWALAQWCHVRVFWLDPENTRSRDLCLISAFDGVFCQSFVRCRVEALTKHHVYFGCFAPKSVQTRLFCWSKWSGFGLCWVWVVFWAKRGSGTALRCAHTRARTSELRLTADGRMGRGIPGTGLNSASRGRSINMSSRHIERPLPALGQSEAGISRSKRPRPATSCITRSQSAPPISVKKCVKGVYEVKSLLLIG